MKRAAVTGASRGIGRAIAIDLSNAGYEVYGTYNHSEEEAEKLATKYGIQFHQADLAKRADTLRLAKRLSSLSLNALINNAAAWEKDKVSDMDFDTWDNIMEVNLTAPVILSTILAKSMARGASIVNISSTDGMTGAYDLLSYSASKAGLLSITKSLGNTLGAMGIRVNAIAPGWIDTHTGSEESVEIPSPSIPLGRSGKPEEIASLVEFLISDKASYINGETIVMDGGLLNADYELKTELGY